MRIFSFLTATTFSILPLALAAQTVSVTPIAGNEALTRVIESAALTTSLGQESGSTTQDYIAAARADYRRILTALYSEGYYGGTISITLDGREAAQIQPLDAPREIKALRITVVPGPIFRFGEVQLSLPNAPANSRLPDLPEGFKTGEIARSDVIAEAARTRLSWARDNGYPKAQIAEERITARHSEAQINAAVTIDMGPRLTFGDLSIVQDAARPMREDRLRAILGYPQGALVTPAERERAAARLRVTGAFSSVSLTEAERPVGDTLPHTLTYALLPAKRLGYSAQISSTEGLSASGYWMHRNFWGGAENLRLGLDVTDISGGSGGTDYMLSADLRRPAFFNFNNTLFVSSALGRENEEDYLRDSFKIAARVEREIHFNVQISYGLGLEYAREETAALTRDYTLLTFPLTALRDKRDNPLNATRGSYAELTLTPFIGDRIEGGAQLTGDLRGYRERGRFTIAGRAQMGLLFGPELTEAPANFLFYSGGGGTVRGQDYQSLGIPVGRSGLRTGGRAFYGAQLEARADITSAIEAVAFYDIGLIDRDPNLTDDYLWHAGTGIGVRYGTPIGPIRLDIGTPASGETAFEKAHFYIGIGQAF